MSDVRLRRVESLLREEIGTLILQSEIKDPRVSTMLSVTDVEVTKDLGNAKVFISGFVGKDEIRKAIDALNHAAGFIQRKLRRRVSLRSVPHLVFYADQSIEHGFQVTQIIKEVANENDDDNGSDSPSQAE
jgi:ribosome-binding factor A